MASPDLLLVGAYDYRLVALSGVMAVLASYTALDLSGRVTAARGVAQPSWLLGGAVAMGIGIWSMHFIGMLAFRLPVPVQYDLPTVGLSLLAGILSSVVALFVVSRREMGSLRALGGSIFMGGGIAALHYTAMEAMRLPAMCHYSPALVILSVAFAIAGSLLSLRLTFLFRDEANDRRLRKAASALLMGAAICVMHYTGMAAASFMPSAGIPDLSHAVSISTLGSAGIGTVSVMVLGIALLTSLADRFEQQRALLDELFEQAPQAVALMNVDHRIVRVNREFTRLFGYPPHEALGRRLEELIVPDELREEYQRYTNTLARRLRVEAETVRHRKDGVRLPVSLVRVPVAVPGGQIATYAIFHDISQRKRSEEQIHFQASLLDHVRNAVIAIDLENTVTSWNRFAETLYHWTAKEAVGRDIVELIVPDDARKVGQAILASLRDGDHWDGEFSFRKKDGSTFPAYVHAATIRGTNGEIIGFVGVHADITERKRVEEELRRVQDDLAEAQRLAKLGSWRFDIATGTLSWSEELFKVFNVAPRGAGQTYPAFMERVCPEDRALVEAVNSRARADGKPFELEYRIISPAGQLKTIREVGYAIKNEHGGVIGLFGTAQDITDRKHAEDQLQAFSQTLIRAQEDERRRIAQELHDEIGQALTALKFNLQSLQRTLGTAAPALDESIEIADTTLRQVRELSLDLRPSLLDDLGLYAALRWYVDRQAQRAGWTAQFSSDRDAQRFPADIETVCFRVAQQALTNVIRHARATRVWIDVRRRDHELQLTLRDDGVGFDVDAARQRARAGHTLGLLGMQERVTLAGGRFEIHSAPGSGAEIRVYLPIPIAGDAMRAAAPGEGAS